MISCIGDNINGHVTTFYFSDDSTIDSIQNHKKSPPVFEVSSKENITEAQKNAIMKWSFCNVEVVS